MRTVIAVDLDTMRELADEEATVRSEKTDWCEAAYREEAVRRVEERRETQKTIETWEATDQHRDLLLSYEVTRYNDHAKVGFTLASATPATPQQLQPRAAATSSQQLRKDQRS